MLLESNKEELGLACPDFSLPSVDGKNYELNSFNKSRALLVAFICRHCPYVLAIEDRLLKLSHSYDVKQLQTVAICSNDWQKYSADSPANLLARWKEKQYNFPYLLDESQQIAKDFDAVCTPDLFLYDEKRELYYHGRLDDNWKDASKVVNQELKNAIDLLLSGKKPPEAQSPTIGCSIKWR